MSGGSEMFRREFFYRPETSFPVCYSRTEASKSTAPSTVAHTMCVVSIEMKRWKINATIELAPLAVCACTILIKRYFDRQCARPIGPHCNTIYSRVCVFVIHICFSFVFFRFDSFFPLPLLLHHLLCAAFASCVWLLLLYPYGTYGRLVVAILSSSSLPCRLTLWP